MSTKTAVATSEGDGLRFRVRTGSGHELILDNAEGNTGPRPAELVLVAHGGCTAMDVLSILRKKRQVVTRYEVEVAAEQRDAAPNIFVSSVVTHVIEGPAVDEAAVRRAIELSALKYCSVGATLSAGPVEVHHRYRIVGPAGTDPVEGEVLVTGPNADFDAASGGPGGE
jgi:putative redox protein